MSLDIIKKNSGSPFYLQRSMVSQSGEGGAYESGGFDPSLTYNDASAANIIASIGKVIGAGLASRTVGDEIKSNENKQKRLEARIKRIDDKSSSSVDDKQINRLKTRKQRVADRIENTKNKIYISKEKQSLANR